MDEIVFSCAPDEVSCLVGNLFSSLDPPCEYEPTEGLTLCGTTHSGRYARLVIREDRCLFYGERDDLEAVRGGKCPERRCKHG